MAGDGRNVEELMGMVDYDTPWKEILEFYLKQFLELCLPDLHGAMDCRPKIAR